jgi:PGF-pre-PGF domain-containing protein
MKSQNFKTYAKYGLFLLLVISLAGTASAATDHTGGIALCWDDIGNIDPCNQNLKMFQNYSANCTMFINSVSESPQDTRGNLSALRSAGWEIAAHGQNHNDSIAYLNSHTSAEWLNQEIFPNIVELTGYGYPVYSFAYPYGSRNETTDALLAPYFRTIRSTAVGVVNVNESNAYYNWNDTQVLYGIEIDDQSGVSLESILSGIDYAMEHDCVLILYGHKITSNATEDTSDYQTSTSRLESILNHTSQKNGTFYLMRDLGNPSWEQSSPRFSNVIANFTVSADSVFVGENVTFRDYSVNKIAEFLDFGDGSNSSAANVVHKYTMPGTYNAILTVKNDVSNQSMTKAIKVFELIAPGANFISNPTTGVAPLSVVFTDTSTGLPTSWSWDFGDGSNSTDKNPMHVYSAAGTYTVNLTATNVYGGTSKTAQIIVDRRSSGSSHGGGGGGSPEPASNVEAKELSQAFVTNDKAVQFDFTKNATCVVYVGFDAKKTVGRTTTIAEQLKNKSTLTYGLPDGVVYKYFNVWVGNSGYATGKNIGNSVICFKVPKSWIQDKKIDPNSITLNRYNNKTWEQIPASFLREDDKYLYFKSSVSGYSFFAITGKIMSNEEDENNTGDVVTPGTQENEQNDTKTGVNQTFVRRRWAPGFETVYCVIGLLGVSLYRRIKQN